MRAAFMFLALVALPKAFCFPHLLREEWQTFKLAYGKIYVDEAEEQWRWKTFKQNKLLIAQHNQLYAVGAKDYEMALNELSDMKLNAYLDDGNGYRRTEEGSENIEDDLTNIENTEDAENAVDSWDTGDFDDSENEQNSIAEDDDETSALLSVLKEEWRAYKLTYNKNYPNEVEDARRFEAFNKNRLIIAKHNQLYHTGKKSFELGVNHLSDLTREEYLQMVECDHMNTFSTNEDMEDPNFVPNLNLPTRVDWRSERIVTEIKNQGYGCGSCWSFAATGVLEGQHARKSGRLVSLSEQNLLDCSHDYGNNGCYGGNTLSALEYVKANGGIDTEISYPYFARTDYQCHFRRENVGANATGYVQLPSGNEMRLMQAVAEIGPIAVTIDASHESFQNFKGKVVYDEPSCSSTKLNHAVLVVGYGSYGNGIDYWLVKNSWGKNWGDSGYIRMSRNKGNQCGIATRAKYVNV